jgi:hypothetical protein
MKQTTAGALALLLAALLLSPASEAQNGQRVAPGVQVPPVGPPPQGQVPPPQVRDLPPGLPHYYLERRGVEGGKGTLGPNDVAASLRARGFRDIAPVQQRGKTMIIPRAIGPSGERVQLVIGPGGEIVGVRVLRPDER